MLSTSKPTLSTRPAPPATASTPRPIISLDGDSAPILDNDDDDLPPPLEDASAELAAKRAAAAVLKQAVRTRMDHERERVANRRIDSTTLADGSPAVAPVPASKPKGGAERSTGAKPAWLAGMKRGFLNNSSGSGGGAARNKTPTAKKDEIPTLSVGVDKGRKKEDPLVFSEVQEALKEAKEGQMDPNLYVTPSLLGTIDSDAHLRSTFDDPGFADFLALVQQDPSAAQKRYDPQRNPKADRYWKTMQRVTGLMGKEMEKNAPAPSLAASQEQARRMEDGVLQPKIEVLDDDEEDPKGAAPKTRPEARDSSSLITPVSTKSTTTTTKPPSTNKRPNDNDLPAHERALVERVQNDARVREALMDPQVQSFLDGMRRGGGGVELGQFIAQASRNPPLMAKIKVLMEVGLLQVQR